MDPSLTTSGTSKTCPQQCYESCLRFLQQIDEWLSKPILELSLPPILEFFYSIPANFFGLIPILFVGPSVLCHIGLYTFDNPQNDDTIDIDHTIKILGIVIVSLSTIFFIAWTVFLIKRQQSILTKFLGKGYLYLLAFLWNVFLLYYILIYRFRGSHVSVPTNDDVNGRITIITKSFSLALYPLYLWSPSVLIVLIMKRWSLRHRPCLKYNREWILKYKYFSHIPFLLIETQGDESFPSGDAATSMVFAIPFFCVASQTNNNNITYWTIKTAAWCMVILVCTGRIYFLAHHVSDVIVGAMIPYFVHYISTNLFHFGIFDMQWWHPLLANAIVATYAAITKRKVANLESKKKIQ